MKAVIAAAIMSFAATTSFAKCNFDRQVEVLALNMYHEARGEGPDGMQMVGEVTLNRVEHPRYPNDVCSVVYQRRQFSWTHQLRNHTPHEKEVWKEALELAEDLLVGEIELFDNGATHFLNPNAVRGMPAWTRRFEMVGRVGRHVFYEKPRG